jgi:hypothetical protein
MMEYYSTGRWSELVVSASGMVLPIASSDSFWNIDTTQPLKPFSDDDCSYSLLHQNLSSLEYRRPGRSIGTQDAIKTGPCPGSRCVSCCAHHRIKTYGVT